MYTPESWRTLVFLKAVIHFVGTDDDGGEKERESEGGRVSWLKGAIKWLKVVPHVLANEAEEDMKGRSRKV